MSFSNKVVLVTGASSGIGAACAVSFAKEGANVVLVGRQKEKLQKVTAECISTGNEPLLIIADISDEDAGRKIVNDTIEKFGKLDVLVNNAGITRQSNILDANVMKVYHELMKTNLQAHVFMTHLAAPHLMKTKGNIVFISSVSAKMVLPNSTLYSSSKAAIDHFARGVAGELAPHGVRVNAVSPGLVRTDIAANAGIHIPLDVFEKILPLQRVSEPVEVADLVLFLASNKAIAITGVDYVIDNGGLIKR